MREELTDEERAWLAELEKTIWRGERPRNETRALTVGEIDRLTRCIERCELPCSYGHEPYGFFLEVRDHSPIPEVEPVRLLCVSPRHIPNPEYHGFAGQGKAFTFFKRFTHTDRNKELLDFYGIEQDDDPLY